MARPITRCLVLALVVLTGVADASAQPQAAVRVTAREAEIRTRPDARSPMIGRAVTGTVLQVVASENNWYLVVIPPYARLVPTAPERGYVDAKAVTMLPAGDPRATAAAGQRPGQPPRPKGTLLRWRVFGSAAYERFQASKSFEAVFGSASAPAFGGGVGVLLGRHVFVEGAVDYVQRTGERVFVFEGEVFPLGITEKMTLTTVAINGGYRFGSGRGLTPYVGGGALLPFYKEDSPDVGAGGESTSESGVGAQALGGVEFRVSRWVAAAVEGRYSYLPGIIGDGGVSKEFGEDNLGGASVAVKLIIGK